MRTCPCGRRCTRSSGETGFVPVTVALDRSADDARPFIERARPTHPSLIDTRAPRRPPVRDDQRADGGVHRRSRADRAPERDGVRHRHVQTVPRPRVGAVPRRRARWARSGRSDVAPDQVAQRTVPPTRRRGARARRVLARLAPAQERPRRGRRSATSCGRASSRPTTGRSGAAPCRSAGKNPMGPEFFELFREWEANGKPGYESLARKRNG